MMDDSERYIHDDDGFDEAFADLCDSLRKVQTGISSPSAEAHAECHEEANDSRPETETKEDEDKFSREEVAELNQRIGSSTRSPFERFRSQRPALSVTDLVSPDWCETQYLYSLEKGKKRRTEAMVQGHRIHKELEHELHDTVNLAHIPNAEEAWGIKLLNILFGLWELNFRGMTREFPVFGFLEDHLVLGVIDEIYQLPESQGEHGPMDIFVSVARKKKFGISDVKTRVNSSLPRDRNSRAAEMQLSVYYRLLAVMVDGTVDMKRLYSELGLDSQVCFSDAFLVEAGTTYSDIGVLGFDVLLENNCLDKLWNLVLAGLKELKGSLEKKMHIEYRHQGTNQVIGSKSFEYNDDALTSYLKETLAWWDGKRPAKGVEIEEAYKCRACDFEEGCTWRAAKILELSQRRQSQSPPAQYQTLS